MGLLDQLAGVGGRRDEYQDYTDRYDRGRPHEGYEDDEVARRCELDEDNYRHSARQAYERMDPDERHEFGRQLAEHVRSREYEGGYDGDRQGEPSAYDDSRYRDPQQLADMTTRVHQQSPSLLGELLAGVSGGGAGGAGGAMGSLLGGHGGNQGGASNPLAKAAMAGITAYAAKQMINRR